MSLAACLPVARPVTKLGLVAPFEGRYRDVGYEVIYAVRLAVREANARGGVAGHTVELMALDDSGDPAMAVTQAQKLATDPQLVGVIGHWLDETTVAAAPAYDEAGVPLFATTAEALPAGALRLWPTEAALAAALPPETVQCPSPCGWLEGAAWAQTVGGEDVAGVVAGPALWAFPQFATLAGASAEGVIVVLPAPLPAQSSDPGFADRYRGISNGVAPGAYAVLAYDAANALLAAIEASGEPTREGVAEALSTVAYEGLSGTVAFDANGERADARGWAYEWRDGQLVPRP